MGKFISKIQDSSLRNKLMKTPKYLICGALSWMSAATFVYPIDLVKTILSVQTNVNS